MGIKSISFFSKWGNKGREREGREPSHLGCNPFQLRYFRERNAEAPTSVWRRDVKRERTCMFCIFAYKPRGRSRIQDGAQLMLNITLVTHRARLCSSRERERKREMRWNTDSGILLLMGVWNTLHGGIN